MVNIQGYPNYLISEQGEVFSLLSNKFLTPCLNKRKGYYQVTLYKAGYKEKFLVHVLVAEAYIPNPLNKPFVNHKNGVKTDNSVENLEWVTHKENMQHAFTNNLVINPAGTEGRNYQGDTLVFRDGVHIDTLFGNKDMVLKGYSPSAISMVINGTRKTHKGCTFERVKK